MKLIIAGGRGYHLTEEDRRSLDLIGLARNVTEVVSGGANGADSDGEQWAVDRNIRVRTFVANWAEHGKAAGPLRNKEMAEYADAVALFPGGRGTQSMFREATKAGLEVYDMRNREWPRREG